MNRLIEEMRIELVRNADESVKQQGERFFREEVKLYGIRSAVVRKTGMDHFKTISKENKSYIFSLCEELWQSGIMEESIIACNWSYYVFKSYEKSDFLTFEKWVNTYISNWATCDTFCNHTVGTFMEMYPAYISHLKRWAKSDIRWVRRASAVSLIVPARKGMFLEDIFEIAEILHSDNDDMVQKGYGWMLKVASQMHEKRVYDYVFSKKATMPRTALRYAIEKMPAELKQNIMVK